MASVTEWSLYKKETADSYLTYLEREWSSLPELAEEWDEYDVDSKVVFDHEWGIREDRFRLLKTWSEQGLLTKEQQARYEELLKLMERNRPILERLLSEE